MSIKVGDKIPAAILKHKTSDGVTDISTDELYADKAKGVDTIACLSVNEAFVMDAWGIDQNAGDKVMMLADGSGLFTKAIGKELDRTEAGMGMRSARYAMIVDNGVVTEMLAEEPGAFEVSSAEFVLGKL